MVNMQTRKLLPEACLVKYVPGSAMVQNLKSTKVIEWGELDLQKFCLKVRTV